MNSLFFFQLFSLYLFPKTLLIVAAPDTISEESPDFYGRDITPAVICLSLALLQRSSRNQTFSYVGTKGLLSNAVSRGNFEYNGEFGAAQFAEPTPVALFNVFWYRNVVSLRVDLVGYFKNVGRA